MMGPVGGSGGWLCEKKLINFFLVPNDLKSPENNMSFFVFIHIWGVGGSDPNMDISIFFLFFLLNPFYHSLGGRVSGCQLSLF